MGLADRDYMKRNYKVERSYDMRSRPRRKDYRKSYYTKKGSKNIVWKLNSYLKKKRVGISIIVLGAFLPWFIFLLTCSPFQLQAYHNFLSFGVVVFSVTLIFGLALGIPPKKKPKVRIQGDIFIEEGAEMVIRTPKPKYRYVSKEVIKYLLFFGSILSILGFGYGIISSMFGYISIGLGGFLLGAGIIFSFRPLMW